MHFHIKTNHGTVRAFLINSKNAEITKNGKCVDTIWFAVKRKIRVETVD
jgi:hypothetical protein